MTTVACIGAGTVGRAWAVVFARAGHQVRLYDANPTEIVERALPLATKTLELLAAAGLLEESVATVLGRISVADSIATAVASAAYVQESVREDIETKREVFSAIADAAPETAILASSTSAIRASEFLGHIRAPERALVAHPVNPPSLIPLVELCASAWTSDATLEAARTFLTAAGMKPVTVLKEIDGFLLNRLQFTLVAEAMHLVGKGYCSIEDIDRVLTEGLALRWAFIGPFEVAHLNAPDGFKGFVDRLGPMMRHLAAEAQTTYDWTGKVDDMHGELVARTPVADIAARQAWRDEQILRLRQLKRDSRPTVPDASTR
jgi:3-hydroxyacyl-CoA dehydrogenase